MVINSIIAVIGTIYCWQAGLITPGLLIFAFVFAIATNMSITAGYHRLFSHRSYEARTWVEAVFLLIGASAFQGSCLKWSSDHRQHHTEIDSENDPYSINKGFWYAHMGWLFLTDSVDREIRRVPDLQKNRLVVLQHKYYVLLASFMAFVVPMIVGGLLFKSFLAGLLIAGSLRIFLTQQSTFFVNSLCHYFGRQTYSKDISARDSFIVAILTHGEGYHNFHHTFQIDYRNGIRWYQWDPTKWMIVTMKWFGMAMKLRQAPPAEILKARLQTEGLRLHFHGFSPERVEQLKQKVLEAQVRWRQMKEEYAVLRKQAVQVGEEKLKALRLEIDLAKTEFKYALKQWRLHLQAAPAYA